ncbi:D-2-hydroxyacid dehydrogenase [Fibrisoma montanum]|uniref:D-2-hydroxyacid dehydrogenase n=1 Tax=Fibrisoma montanum TaxID=2305895 RepID=A0A418MJR4_9BACT|nr:D-2-hydroxyacid dehydrogenase [Fibrisoma montanum]RIV27662.1 D-2-hydroxyacid dehydrogenase [Fibrisoma montanum]
MTIVYPDAYTLNPGDLDWAPLQALGDVVFYNHTPADKLAERINEADAILVNKTRLDRSLLQQLPRLKYIGVTATGYDIIDVAAAREQGIVVTNVKGYSTDSVAQQTFALLLELTNHAGLHNESVHAGEWVKSPDFCYWRTPLVELSGKTLGLVGYGDIGRKVAEIGRAFGMNVLVNRRHPTQASADGVRFVDIETVFSESDVVSLHCPATPETIGLVNYHLMAKMKPTAYLINTSRGSLFNEPEVADALNQGLIAGAGIDVLSVEPPKADNPLLTAKNCLITPHVSWATFEARQRLLARVVQNLQAFLDGSPINVVS